MPRTPSQRGRWSRGKGKRREREWATIVREMGCTAARRGRQYKGDPSAPDCVTWPGTHCEVKGRERSAVHDWIEQAAADAGDAVPYVAWKRSSMPWLVVVRADDLLEFCRAVVREADE